MAAWTPIKMAAPIVVVVVFQLFAVENNGKTSEQGGCFISERASEKYIYISAIYWHEGEINMYLFSVDLYVKLELVDNLQMFACLQMWLAKCAHCDMQTT